MIGRTLLKIGYTFKQVRDPKQHLAGVFFGLLPMLNHVPVLRTYAETVFRICGKAEAITAPYKVTNLKCYPLVFEAYTFACIRYNVSYESIKALEQQISEVTTLPVIINSPLMACFLMGDVCN
jgi:hypothetical protein